MRGGYLVLEARRRGGLTQRELAERVGTTQSAIARLERGATEPTFERVAELVDACGLALVPQLLVADDSDWSVASGNLVVDPETRARRHQAALRFAEAGRKALAMPEPEFRPELLLQVLARHRVRAVLIGGFAAVIHGSPYVTTDVDIVPDASTANLERLSAALDELHARVWTEDHPEGIPFDRDAASLDAVEIWNLVTDHGRLDLTFAPSGTAGYADMARDAVHLTILGAEVDVASLGDVIRSKEAAGREKDRLVLPVLRRIWSETHRD